MSSPIKENRIARFHIGQSGIHRDRTGKTFYVHNSGSDSGAGSDPGAPFATADFAVGRCTADVGDTILIMEGHNENLSGTDGVDVDVSGVTIIGLGNGRSRPRFDHDATASEWVIGAANVVIDNIWFQPGADAVTNAINIEAAGDDYVIRNCQFGVGEAATDEFADAIIVEAGADRGLIEKNKFEAGTQAAVSAIELNGAVIGITIQHNDITGDYSVANIRGDTTLSQDVIIRKNLLVNGVTGGLNAQPVIDMVSVVTTGYITDNDIFCNLTSPHLAVVATGCLLAGNRYSENLWTTTSFGGGIVNADAQPAHTRITEGLNPFGHVWYVAASGGTDGAIPAGLDPQFPLATIAQAIVNGIAGDTIIIGPGDHSVDVSSAALIPLADMQFIGAIPAHGGMPSTIISVDADDGADMITIDVDGTYWKDIMFQHFLNAGTAIRLFDLAATTAVQGLTFVDCWFDMNSADVAGGTAINADDATNTVEGMVLKNCRFTGGDATSNADNQYIDIGVRGFPAGLIENCVFGCEGTDDDYVAIRFADPTTTGRNYALVIDGCKFIGPVDGAVSMTFIVATGGSTAQFPFIITDCRSCYSTALWATQNVFDEALVQNYTGDLAVGGTLLIPGT